jgi:superfamily I DNA/RNA helicase
MLDFSTHYPNTQFIVLQTNYRSHQEILNASSKLIQNNNERIVNKIPKLEKKLISADSDSSLFFSSPDKGRLRGVPLKKAGVRSPKLLRASSDIEEKSFILENIKEKINS